MTDNKMTPVDDAAKWLDFEAVVGKSSELPWLLPILAAEIMMMRPGTGSGSGFFFFKYESITSCKKVVVVA